MEDPTRSFDPAVLFEFLIGTLCGVVEIVGPRHGISDAVMGLIWRRVRRLGDRFAKLVERIRAGGGCDAAPVRSRGASEPKESISDLPPRRALGKLRQHYGWLKHLLRETEGSQNTMYWVLARPEFKELIAQAPLQFSRVLRPLCRMLGVELPIVLLLADRERKAKVLAERAIEPEVVSAEPVEVRASPRRPVRKYPPAPDFMANDPAAIHRPDGSIWMRFGASRYWRPGGRGKRLRRRRSMTRRSGFGHRWSEGGGVAISLRYRYVRGGG